MPYIPPSSPYFCTFQLKVGDNILDPTPPQHLIDFSYEFGGGGECSTIDIKLFDSEWFDIEEMFRKGKDNVSVRWGYNTEMTAWHKILLTEFIPSFQPAGMAIQIRGTDVGFLATVDRRNDTYGGMSPTEVAKKIAERNKWNYEIDETMPVLQADDVNSKQKVKRNWNQNNVDDLHFLQTHVLPYANGKSGRGGFEIWFDETKNTLHMHPPRLEAPVFDTYIVHRATANEGVVLSFTPEITGLQLLGWAGANNTQTRGWNTTTRDMWEFKANNQNVDTVNTGRKTDAPTKTDAGTASKTIISTAKDATTGIYQAKQEFSVANNMLYQATMEILGDPRMDLRVMGKNINVVIILKNNQPYYLSGKFNIYGFSHSISGGRYTTTLRLRKNAALEGEVVPLGPRRPV